MCVCVYVTALPQDDRRRGEQCPGKNERWEVYGWHPVAVYFFFLFFSSSPSVSPVTHNRVCVTALPLKPLAVPQSPTALPSLTVGPAVDSGGLRPAAQEDSSGLIYKMIK